MSGISVVIPLHNGRQWILGLLNSIQVSSQECKVPIEILIFDDYSTDGSLELVSANRKTISLEMQLVSWLKYESAGSSSASYSKIIANLNPKFEIIALSDQDDIWLPNRASRIVDAFAVQKELLLYAGTSLLWDSKSSGHMKFRSNPGPRGRKYIKKGQLDPKKIYFDVACSTHNIVFSKKFLHILKEHPLENSDIRVGIEADNWIPLIATTHGLTIVDTIPTVIWRQHSDNSSGYFLNRFTVKNTLAKIFKFSKIRKSNLLYKYYANFLFIMRGRNECIKCAEASQLFNYYKFESNSESDNLINRIRFALDWHWKHWSFLMNLYMRILIIFSLRKE